MLDTLKILSSDRSFRSTRSGPELYRKRFADLKICESFSQREIKAKCNLQFGIVPHINDF